MNHNNILYTVHVSYIIITNISEYWTVSSARMADVCGLQPCNSMPSKWGVLWPWSIRTYTDPKWNKGCGVCPPVRYRWTSSDCSPACLEVQNKGYCWGPRDQNLTPPKITQIIFPPWDHATWELPKAISALNKGCNNTQEGNELINRLATFLCLLTWHFAHWWLPRHIVKRRPPHLPHISLMIKSFPCKMLFRPQRWGIPISILR